MTALRLLRDEFVKIGYSAIVSDYIFSDVFASTTINRAVPIAAFTHTPPSYRNAALAVVQAKERSPPELVSEYRALGAPLLFVIERYDVTVWQVRSVTGPVPLARVSQDQLSSLFSKNQVAWSPRSIHLAKSIGQFNRQYQLDFVDSGLLPAIEGEIHTKLDRLLSEALAEAIDARAGRARINEHSLFRAVFRFLAAKILQDRSHELAQAWHSDKIETILDAISNYYNLPSLPVRPGTSEYGVLSSVWQRIRRGINFQNISADDLAFVYESTLVTPEIRKRFGTHSTPRVVAEYVVSHLDLLNYEPEMLRVYEPFAGAAVFLVAALRHLRERLPVEWTDPERHEFLVQRIAGDEIDAFACEVAMLSLILADYPNRNGWQVRNINLFEDRMLDVQMGAHNVILCNPPFEAFSNADRKRYSIGQKSPFQAAAVLNAALDAHPLALGFVLPRPFILERQFIEQRRRIEALYGAVELVELPDRTFRASDVESALLIAREPRPPAPSRIILRSTEVADRDRLRFLKTGEATTSRELVRPISDEPKGELWLPALGEVWNYLKSYPKLGSRVRPRWGLRWTYKQENACSDRPREGFRRGLHNAKHHKQFFIGRPVFLDFRLKYVREAYDQDWDKPKLIINAARLSRGPWRIGAITDFHSLLYSQQFYGLWPIEPIEGQELLALSAVLNGPVANAFVALHSPSNRFRALAVQQIPIPSSFPSGISELVAEYSAQVNKPRALDDQYLGTLLSQIDAIVLKAYDLPPRLERDLLEYFRGSHRPVAHSWQHWFPEEFKPFIPLHRYLSDEYKIATSGWVNELFRPLPKDEAAALREYMD
jgi:hypothetical protein